MESDLCSNTKTRQRQLSQELREAFVHCPYIYRTVADGGRADKTNAPHTESELIPLSSYLSPFDS